MRSSEILRAHGKCILTGEHAVVRGAPAIVFPLRSRSLTLAWHRQEHTRFVVKKGPLSEPFALALERAQQLTSFRGPLAAVSVELESDIPVRAGLGSSAALSVAVVRFLESQGAKVADPFILALEVENLFHGKSSGIDIAAVLADAPIEYRKGAAAIPLATAWRPALYLFDTGERSSTKTCVEKVEAAKRADLDRRMEEASLLAAAALRSHSPSALRELAAAMDLAASCFSEWGLGAPERLVKLLREAGALAVKPTGSGGGGHLLTLWAEAPPPELNLFPVAADS